MMRRFKLIAALPIAGAAFALTACGGGGEANNMADNATNGFGNTADPGAVETIGNGTEAGNDAVGNSASGTGTGTGTGTGNASGTGAGGNSGAGTDSGTPPSGADVGGDAGGNAAGGNANRI